MSKNENPHIRKYVGSKYRIIWFNCRSAPAFSDMVPADILTNKFKFYIKTYGCEICLQTVVEEEQSNVEQYKNIIEWTNISQLILWNYECM